MGAINKSYVPREAVQKVTEKGLETFRKMNGRNPDSKERSNIERSVKEQAERLNRR